MTQPLNEIEVLITDAHTRAGLAVARSLAQRQIPFTMVGSDASDLAFQSRFVRNKVLVPSAIDTPDAFVGSVLELVRQFGIKLVIPVADQAVFLLDRHRDRFEGVTRLAMPSSEALRSVLDKRKNLKIARQNGIPCPRQFELTKLEEIPDMIKALGFPIVLKNPGFAFDTGKNWFDFRVLKANTEQELRHLLENHCRHGEYPLFQECVDGEIHNLCCFATNGEVLAIHEYQSVRRCGGQGVLRRVVDPVPELALYTKRLLRSLSWDGIAHVAFFITKDRKNVWYMEVNGRFWASTQGSIYAGWDFPFWCYQYFLHSQRPNPNPLRVGSMTCWHRGDLEALVSFFRGGPPPATGTRPNKILAVLQYLSGFSPRIHSDVFRWDDPWPGIMEHLQFLKSAKPLLAKRLLSLPSILPTLALLSHLEIC